nr:PfkB family carbohydrate kinase [Nakamurella flavida]
MSAYDELDVIGGGAASVDRILLVDAPLGDSKGRVLLEQERYGGNVATAMVAAARGGATTAFVGHLPARDVEPGLWQCLRHNGVRLDLARTAPGQPGIRATILVDPDGRRFIAVDDDAPIGLPDDLDLELVRHAKVLLLDGYAVPAGVRAARAAREAGRGVVLDLEKVHHPETELLVDLSDHLVLPESFAVQWTGTNSPARAIAALWRADRCAVVITCGDRGAYFVSADDGTALGTGVLDRIQHQSVPPVQVKDTTGCGDVFHGAYAAALARGLPIAQCVAGATAAAAECATRVGGIPADS